MENTKLINLLISETDKIKSGSLFIETAEAKEELFSFLKRFVKKKKYQYLIYDDFCYYEMWKVQPETFIDTQKDRFKYYVEHYKSKSDDFESLVLSVFYEYDQTIVQMKYDMQEIFNYNLLIPFDENLKNKVNEDIFNLSDNMEFEFGKLKKLCEVIDKPIKEVLNDITGGMII